MEQEVVELKTFKRISESKIALDGLIWTTDAERGIPLKNEETGHIVHSVKVDGVYYFPMAFDNRKQK